MVNTFASILLLLAICCMVPAVPHSPLFQQTGDHLYVQHRARIPRGVLEGLAKSILNPFNILGRHHGPGSSAHSDSINVGATLPFGFSAGISGSSSDAHSDTGDVASASSGSGSSGYPNHYGSSGSMASAGRSNRYRRSPLIASPQEFPKSLLPPAGVKRPGRHGWSSRRAHGLHSKLSIDGLKAEGNFNEVRDYNTGVDRRRSEGGRGITYEVVTMEFADRGRSAFVSGL